MDFDNLIIKTDKDFYNVKDFEVLTGLSTDTCYKLIRKIKSVSDVFGIMGVVHRVDYIAYLQWQYAKKAHTDVPTQTEAIDDDKGGNT